MTKTKKAKIVPQTLKGFRDFLPEEMVIRQKVIDILKNVFESYGFEPLETPALEYAETLLGKYGEEADRLVYIFKDKGDREIGLRYDLTVPVARVLAQYKGEIPLPFKRYQIQPAWRAEKPQKGRYREFAQCDVDTFGIASPLADAEILTVISSSLTTLGLKNFAIRINSRQAIFDALKKSGIGEEKYFPILQSLDKFNALEKVAIDRVEIELKQKGISVAEFQKVIEVLRKTNPDKNLSEVIRLAQKMGAKNIEFSKNLVRGLDYYTGPVFETYVKESKIGSITGGGRYDKLISILGGPDIPATGTTIGLDRICEVIKEQNLWPEIKRTKTQVLVTIFSPEFLEKSIEVASKLRFENKINTELYPDPQVKLDKQLKYADRKGIPLVVILGPEEIRNNQVSIKDLRSGKQTKIKLTNLNEFIN